MSFTITCPKCGLPMYQHIVTNTKSGRKTQCPGEHFRSWIRKWGWKFRSKYTGQLDINAAKKAYDRVAFRMPKVGQPGARRPTPKNPMRRSMNQEVCDYCRLSHSEHTGKALYCPTEANMMEHPEDRNRFGKKPRLERYSVVDEHDIVIGHVKARSLWDATDRAHKTYGSRANMVWVENGNHRKVGEHRRGEGHRKIRHRAPWTPGKKKRTSAKACGYCGSSGRPYGLVTDKKYKRLCLKCDERLRKARERAKTGKFSGDPTMRFYVTVKYLDRRTGTVRHTIRIIVANSADEAKRIARRELHNKYVWVSATATRMNPKQAVSPKRSGSKFVDAYAYTRRPRKTSRDRSYEQHPESAAQTVRAFKSAEAILIMARTAASKGNRHKATVLLNSAERTINANFEDGGHLITCGNCMPNAAEARAFHKLMRRVFSLYESVLEIRNRGRRTKKPRRTRRK